MLREIICHQHVGRSLAIYLVGMQYDAVDVRYINDRQYQTLLQNTKAAHGVTGQWKPETTNHYQLPSIFVA